MCVEKDERSTDSRVKTGVQNLLGGLVLGAVPLGAVALIGMWGLVSTHSVQLQQFNREHDLQFEQISREYDVLLRRIETLEAFRNRGKRFTSDDGDKLQTQIEWVRRQMMEHHENAGPLIRQVHHNSEEIQRLRDRGG